MPGRDLRDRRWVGTGGRATAERSTGPVDRVAQFQVAYAAGKCQIKAVTLLRTYETPFRSPQPLLFPLDDAQWRKAFHVTPYAPRRPRNGGTATQLPLFTAESHDALSS